MRTTGRTLAAVGWTERERDDNLHRKSECSETLLSLEIDNREGAAERRKWKAGIQATVVIWGYFFL